MVFENSAISYSVISSFRWITIDWVRGEKPVPKVVEELEAEMMAPEELLEPEPTESFYLQFE